MLCQVVLPSDGDTRADFRHDLAVLLIEYLFEAQMLDVDIQQFLRALEFTLLLLFFLIGKCTIKFECLLVQFMSDRASLLLFVDVDISVCV